MEEWWQSQIEIADIEVRPSDRMQYVTGTYTDYNSFYIQGDVTYTTPYKAVDDKSSMCFLAKLTSQGQI